MHYGEWLTYKLKKLEHMYALHQDYQQPLAEFELGDWKKNRRARLLTFDHGLTSFTDFEYRAAPKVRVLILECCEPPGITGFQNQKRTVS